MNRISALIKGTPGTSLALLSCEVIVEKMAINEPQWALIKWKNLLSASSEL